MHMTNILRSGNLYWNLIRPNILSFLLGKTFLDLSRSVFKLKRLLMSKNKRVLTLFVAVDDVQSFVALQCAEKILQCYDNLDVKIYALEPKVNGWSSSLEMKYDWVYRDSNLFCSLYSLEHPRKPSESTERLNQCTAILTSELSHSQNPATALSTALSVMKMAWDEHITVTTDKNVPFDGSAVSSILCKNRARLQQLGFYNPGAIEFEGEWYPPDRVYHLEMRLREEISSSCSATELIFSRERERLWAVGSGGAIPRSPNKPAHLDCTPNSKVARPTVEFFYSFRSPYSQLVMPRLRAICDKYGADILVRPVLPMVTRGLQVPKEKEWYIGRDAAREGRIVGLPMGKIADPLHPQRLPFLRALDAYSVALVHKREKEFIEAYGIYQWGHGISAGTDAGLRHMVDAAGMSPEVWEDIRSLVHSETPEAKFRRWESLTEENKQFLLDRGLWGVPCLKLGEVMLFGQDKLWAIELLVQKMCTGSCGDAINDKVHDDIVKYCNYHK